MPLLPARLLGDHADLSVPRGAAPRMAGRYDADVFGRMSENIARFLGTGRYLAGQTVFVIIWIALNAVGFIARWDPYPFILLNLAFSTQAAYAAPLILLARTARTTATGPSSSVTGRWRPGPRPTPSSSPGSSRRSASRSPTW